MADIQITNTAVQQVTGFKWPATRVLVRQKYTDDWIVSPYLEVISVTHEVAPSMSQAKFVFNYGEILRAGEAEFKNVLALAGSGLFVKVEVLEGDSPVTEFIGYIPAESFNVYGIHNSTTGEVASGTQELDAMGFEYILRQERIRDAFAEGGGSANFISHVPDFNYKSINGALKGNRSSSKYFSDKCYIFSNAGDYWTNRDIIEYLFNVFSPYGMEFKLGGRVDLLDNIITHQRLEGLSFGDALDHLADRRRGIVWYVECDASDTPVVWFDTIFENTISVGDITIEGNKNTIQLNLGEFVRISDAVMVLNSFSKYDGVEVSGNRIRSCFTLSFADNTLDIGWPFQLEGAYNNVSGEDNEAMDKERKTDKYRPVYRYFKALSNWNWQAGNGEGANKKYVNPAVDDDGNIKQSQDYYFNDCREFLRTLPILQQHDTGEVDYLEPLAVVKNDDGVWVQTDAATGDEKPMSVRLLDGMSGVEVYGEINHLLAKGGWFYGESDIDPQWDFQNLAVTVAVETDTRLKVKALASNAPADPRMVYLDVNDAQLWYVNPGTIIGVTDGKLNRHPGGVVRTDAKKLRRVAAVALAWYGKSRAQVRMTVEDPEFGLTLGMFVRAATTGSQSRDVNTVITKITRDFRSKKSITETGCLSIDASRVIDFPGMSGAAAMGRTVRRMQRDIDEIKASTAKLPLRLAGLGGGGNRIELLKVISVYSEEGKVMARKVNSDGSLLGDPISLTVIPEF